MRKQVANPQKRRARSERPWTWPTGLEQSASLRNRLKAVGSIADTGGGSNIRPPNNCSDRVSRVIERLEAENAMLKSIASAVIRDIEALRVS